MIKLMFQERHIILSLIHLIKNKEVNKITWTRNS